MLFVQNNYYDNDSIKSMYIILCSFACIIHTSSNVTGGSLAIVLDRERVSSFGLGAMGGGRVCFFGGVVGLFFCDSHSHFD